MHTDDMPEIDVLIGEGLISVDDLKSAGLLDIYEEYLDQCLENITCQ